MEDVIEQLGRGVAVVMDVDDMALQAHAAAGQELDAVAI
jgi:hypothetical protein